MYIIQVHLYIIYICLIFIYISLDSYFYHSGSFGSLVILDVARCYLWLFALYVGVGIGKNSC